MVDNNSNDSPSFTNFGIEEPLVGSLDLLQGLYEDETQSADPKGITPIVEESTPPPAPIKPDVKKGKELSTDAPPEEHTGEEVLKNFLSDEEEAPIEPPLATDAPPATPAEETFSQFEALGKDLLKLGVFTLGEGEEDITVKTPEEFLERFNTEKQKGALDMINNFIGKFGDDYQKAFDAIYVKGVSPKDYFGVYNTIVKFAELDLTKEENQEIVMRQSLTEQGWEDDAINAEVERLKSYADLEAVSARHHKALVKKEAKKLEDLERQAQIEQEQKEAIRDQYIQNVKTILNEKVKTKDFDGIPINPKLASELQDFLLVDKWQTSKGERLTDFDRSILDLKLPENHAKKVKVALLLKVLEKDPTLSTIKKTGVTQATNDIFGHLAKADKTPQQKNVTPNNNSFSLGL